MKAKHHAARLVARLARTPDGQQLTEIILETFRLNGRLLDVGDRMTKDLGLSSARWQVLAAVDEEPITVAEVARRMGLRRQSVQRTVNSLHADGFVELEPNPNHRRAKLVTMTSKGFAALEKTYQRQVAWANEAAIGMSTESLKETAKTMFELRDKIESESVRIPVAQRGDHAPR
jgi:DNA-binding MarR family transcriptional regulator